MFGLHGNDMPALARIKLRRAFQREVVRFGRAGGPHDFFRLAMHQRGHFRPRLFHRLQRLLAIGVRTRRRIAKMFGQAGDHLLRDARVERRGRGVVQIDRQCGFHVRTFVCVHQHKQQELCHNITCCFITIYCQVTHYCRCRICNKCDKPPYAPCPLSMPTFQACILLGIKPEH